MNTIDTPSINLLDQLTELLGKLDNLKQEELEKAQGDAKEIEKINTKYKILKITTRYNYLMTLIGIYRGFEKAFLESSANRIKFLTNVELKVKIDSDGEFIESGDADYDSKQGPEWITWKGCDMTIPESVYVAISPHVIWPTLYIKRKNIQDNSEITIHERAWNVDVYALEKNTIKKHGESEYINGMESIHNKLEQFGKIDLDIVDKLEEFEVVIQFPFITPSEDSLTIVQFADSNEIVLTTFC